MHSEGYKRFQDTLSSLLKKKDDLAKMINLNEEIIRGYNQRLDLAELNGETKNVKELRKAIMQLECTTAEMRTTLRAYNTNTDSLIGLLKKNNKELQQAAREVKTSNLKAIARLQQEYDKELEGLAKAKETYLNHIRKMGNAYIQARELAAEIAEIKDCIPDEIPGQAYTGLKTDLDDFSISKQEAGSFIITLSQVEDAFCGNVPLTVFNRFR